MFVEYIKEEKHYRFNIVPIGEVDPHKARPYQAYVSICPFGPEVFAHMKATKSAEYPKGNVGGYQGSVFCRWIYWDLDGPINAPALAQSEAKVLCNHLVTKYGMPSGDIGIYFSGGKGFHVAISAENVGGVGAGPAAVVAAKLGLFTERIVDDCPSELSTFDATLYAPNRYFRLPNSRHPETGLYKIPLSYEELMELEPDDILELAQMPRPNFNYDFSRKVIPKKQLLKLWTIVDAGVIVSPAEKAALASLPGDEAGLFDKAVELAHQQYSVEDFHNNNKNNFTFALAAWCNDLGIGAKGDASRALELILEYRQSVLGDGPEILEDKKIEQSVVNAYKRLRVKFGRKSHYLRKSSPVKDDVRAMINLEEKVIGLRGLRPRQLLEVALALNAVAESQLPEDTVQEIVMKYVRGKGVLNADDMPKPIYTLASQFVDKSQRTANSKGLGFDFIDKAENYDYEGKVVQIIGTGGIGKSLLLKQICIHSAINEERCAYSTMEDTALRLFERVIRLHYDSSYKLDPESGEVIDYVSAIKRLHYLARAEGKTLTEAMSRLLKNQYGDYFLIDERVGMDRLAYQDTIEYLLNTYGDLSKMCIDGLSTMGGSGTEIDMAIRNSFDVKELANEYKLCIPLLVHTPGNVDPEARELWNHTRGGPKIKDNGDLFIALSAIKNPNASGPGKDQYFPDKIAINYWGKRTSGQRLEKVLELDTERLSWEVSELSTEDFEADVF